MKCGGVCTKGAIPPHKTIIGLVSEEEEFVMSVASLLWCGIRQCVPCG